jgi:hypothetical protein
MSNTAVANDLGTGRGSDVSTRPSVALRLNVLAHRGSLDRRLAEGRRTERDAAIALRARQLTSERSRETVAHTLMRTVELAREPRWRGAAAPVDRRAVLDSAPLILGIAQRLEEHAPVDARGVAMIRELLGNGSSPIYAPSLNAAAPDGQLAHCLQQAADALETAH